MRCENATQTTNHDTSFRLETNKNIRLQQTHLDIFVAALATPSSSAFCSSSLTSRQDDGDHSGRRLAVEDSDSADRIVVVAHLFVPVGEEIPGRTKADANRDGRDGEDDAVARARMAADGADTFMAALALYSTRMLSIDAIALPVDENKPKTHHRRPSSEAHFIQTASAP